MTARPNVTIVQDQDLFQQECFSHAFVWMTPLSLGLLKIYRLRMEEGRVYIVDAGFNTYYVYDRVSARQGQKYFWKLNLAEVPPLEGVSLPREFAIPVEIANIPSFDSRWGRQGGSWVKMKYTLLVTMGTTREQVGTLHAQTNPLSTVANAARRVARRVLPFVPYEEAQIGLAEETIQQQLKEEPKIQEIGLNLVRVDIEAIEDSKELDRSLQTSFDRLLEAGDRREIGIQFASMDQDHFQRMIEAEDPRAALEFRSRAANQMLEALLASGMELTQVYTTMGSVAKATNHPDSLSHLVTGQAFDRIKPDNWPELRLPREVSHEERLQWEREVLQERVPAQLQDTSQPEVFSFVLETGDEVNISWRYEEFPPRVSINGSDRSQKYVKLAPGFYKYQDITVWDLYLDTRRLLCDTKPRIADKQGDA